MRNSNEDSNEIQILIQNNDGRCAQYMQYIWMAHARHTSFNTQTQATHTPPHTPHTRVFIYIYIYKFNNYFGAQIHLNMSRIQDLKDLPGNKIIARSYFQAMDSNNDGTLDEKEFGQVLEQLGISLDKDAAFKLLDHNNDGTVSFDEFYKFVVEGRLKAICEDDSKIQTLSGIHAMFTFADTDSDGNSHDIFFSHDCAYACTYMHDV
jgi:EF-hand domain pair